MPETVFRGIFESDLTTVISVEDFMLCLGTALVLGLIMALVYLFRTRYTKAWWLPWRCCLRWCAW